MKMRTRLTFIIFSVAAMVLTVLIVFYVPTKELTKAHLVQFRDRLNDSDELVITLVRTDHFLVVVQETNAISRFVDLVDFEKNEGAVMSAGTFRFIFLKNSKPIEKFQLVLGEYLRHEGGDDYLLTKQSSKAIKQWLLDHGIEE